MVAEKTSVWTKVKKQLMSYHLMIILVIAIVVGITFPAPGKALSQTIFTQVCVFIIFLISGLKLDTSSVKDAVHYWPYFLFGILFILIVYPFVGYLVLLIPVTPRELVIGLSVMCCSPTVLASSAILAEQVSCGSCVYCSVEGVFL